MNTSDNDDDDEYGEDAANQLCAEAWTWTNGRVKSQIDYVWSTSGIRFHGGVRDKLSGDHRPLTYDLEMERYGDGKYGCLRAPSESEEKKRQKSLNGWKPLDPEDFDIASARIANSLLPGGIHHFPDPEKLLLKKGAKRKDDGRAITSSTPCLGSVAECIVASVSNIKASSITSRRNALLAKPQTLKDAEAEVHVALRSMRVRKGTDEEPLARSRLRVI